MSDSLKAPCGPRQQTRAHGLPDVDRALLCTSVTGTSVDEALEGIAKGNVSGADVLELRLDFYKDFTSTDQLQKLMDACELPYIVTYRPSWEGYAIDIGMVTHWSYLLVLQTVTAQDRTVFRLRCITDRRHDAVLGMQWGV